MKTLTLFLTVLAISAGLACAQNTSGNANNPASPGSVAGADVTGFHAPATLGPVQSSKNPNMHPNLEPQLGGIFVDGAKYGTELINPSAAPSAHRQAGGLKLFSFEF